MHSPFQRVEGCWRDDGGCVIDDVQSAIDDDDVGVEVTD